jgi:hypothetical protein
MKTSESPFPLTTVAGRQLSHSAEILLFRLTGPSSEKKSFPHSGLASPDKSRNRTSGFSTEFHFTGNGVYREVAVELR